MRHIFLSALIAGLALAPVPALAAAAPAADAAKGDVKARILGALDLPIKAQALRKTGADEQQIKAGLKAARDKKLHAKDAAELIGEAASAAREHGPVDNFGAFVQERLDAGLRGKELADAIREEHKARGKGKDGKGKPDDRGKPDDAGKPDGAGGPDDKGKPDGAGGPDDKGKPDGAGGPDDRGKPDDAGKPDDKGKPADAGKPDDKGKPADAGKPDDNKGKPADAGKPDEKAAKAAKPK